MPACPACQHAQGMPGMACNTTKRHTTREGEEGWEGQKPEGWKARRPEGNEKYQKLYLKR